MSLREIPVARQLQLTQLPNQVRCVYQRRVLPPVYTQYHLSFNWPSRRLCAFIAGMSWSAAGQPGLGERRISVSRVHVCMV